MSGQLAPDVGGGFGNKVGAYPGYICAAVATIVTGKPVKWVEDRIENLTSTSFARDYHMTTEIAATSEGKVTGLRVHVLADHGNERMTHQLGIRIALVLLGLLGDLEQSELLRALGLGAHLGISLPFSRAHESEADRMGLVLMAAAGFEPAQSVALWRNMAAAGEEQPIELLSTHPAHGTRIEDLQRQLPQVQSLYRAAAAPDCAG